MSSGVMSDPTAIAASMRLWRTPNTRPTTFGGAARCSSVMPVTSTSVLPMPMSAEEDEREPRSCSTSRGATSATPNTASPRRKSPASRLRAVSTTPTSPPSRPPTPSAVFSQPTPAVARVQHADRVHDDHHLERACDEHLRAGQPDHDLQMAVLADRAEAGEQLAADRVLADALGRRVARQAEHADRRPEVRRARKREDEPRPAEREDDAADRRPGEHADARDRVQGEVRRRQLLGRRGERRQQRRLRRAERGRDHRHHDGERVRDERRAAGQATTVMLPTSATRDRSTESMTRRRETRSAKSASHGAKTAASDQRAKRTMPTAPAPSSR